MIQIISDRILDILIRNNAIKDGQKGIIAFGIEQGIRTLTEIVLMLFTGFFMKAFWQGVVILISFTHVRIYAGGYHAKTPAECMIKSWSLFVIVILCHKYLCTYLVIQVIIMIITGIWLVLFCPVQDVHKKLREYEIHKYKKIALRNFWVNTVLFCIGYILGGEEFASCIAMGMLMLLTMLIMGMIKNKITISE